jgi:DNA-binding CsgD family transcriptional regulator
MARDITTMTRELSPFEKRVLELVCEGKSNSAIATATVHTGKVIENTVSRSAQVFGIKSDTDTNLRVLLALAFRSHYGDQAFDKLHEECIQHEIDADGRSYCNGVTHHENTKT